MRRTWLAAAVSLVAVSLAACGQASTSSTSARSTPAATGLSVTPASGGRTSVFTLRFVAPASTGVDGHSTISYTLGITGPSGGRCAGSRSVPVPLAAKGERVAVALGPATLGGNWCVGTYRARVVELQRPVCAPGAVCPQYIRVVAVIGNVTFRVTA
ncbi:MAG: hypothetical protein ACLPTJ_13115 [Solirubrobacteraceae bacterium]